MSLSKVSWAHSHVHSFMHGLWLLWGYNGPVKRLQQKFYDPQSLKYLLSGPLQKVC